MLSVDYTDTTVIKGPNVSTKDMRKIICALCHSKGPFALDDNDGLLSVMIKFTPREIKNKCKNVQRKAKIINGKYDKHQRKIFALALVFARCEWALKGVVDYLPSGLPAVITLCFEFFEYSELRLNVGAGDSVNFRILFEPGSTGIFVSIDLSLQV